MKVLLVYLPTPDTFWSFKHVLRFVSKCAAFPPLGLLTVAAMLPADWQLKLVDMNVDRLTDDDLRWADYVMLGAMIVHNDAVPEVVGRCRRFSKPVIAGGRFSRPAMRPFRTSTISCWVKPKRSCHSLSKTCGAGLSAVPIPRRAAPTRGARRKEFAMSWGNWE